MTVIDTDTSFTVAAAGAAAAAAAKNYMWDGFAPLEAADKSLILAGRPGGRCDHHQYQQIDFSCDYLGGLS